MAQKEKMMFEGNRVMLHALSVEVYGLVSVYGETQGVAEEREALYWPSFFKRLSEHLGASWDAVRLTRQPQIARMDSELAQDAKRRGEPYVVRGEDGVPWLITDNSHNFDEHEFVDPKRSRTDCKPVDRQLNAMRNFPECPTLPETAQMAGQTLSILSGFTKQFELHYSVLRGIQGTLEDFGHEVSRQRRAERERASQRKLGDF
jgi:hypothetical protein